MKTLKFLKTFLKIFIILIFFFEILEILENVENLDRFLYIAWVLLNERVTVKKLLPAEPCVGAECYPRLIQ